MSIKNKCILAVIMICLVSSALIVSDSNTVSADDSSNLKTYDVYATTFEFSDKNNENLNVKWEISYTYNFTQIEEICNTNTFKYTYPYDTGTFYLKEYISDTTTFEPDRTNSETVMIVVEGPSPIITFDSMGGSEVSAVHSPYVLGTPETITEPAAPTRDGYTFNGWYTDPEYNEKFDFSTTVTSDMTLYAKWAPGGGTGGSASLDFMDKYIIPIIAIIAIQAMLIAYFFLVRRKKEDKENN